MVFGLIRPLLKKGYLISLIKANVSFDTTEVSVNFELLLAK